MKTKSKRFLNLATLCLALLGTTLLMGQPVKAEVTKRSQGSDQSEVQEQNPYQEGKSKGHRLGLSEGKKKDAPPQPSNTLPDSNPYSSNSEQNYYYRKGYEEGYTQGYYQGKSESEQSEQDKAKNSNDESQSETQGNG
ncbi:TPA: hypothetical protein ACQOKL_000652, partial [Streptococcus pyogenes]